MSKQLIQWGIAPIGWRNDDMPEIGAGNTLAHLLGDIVVAQFEGTEIGGFFPEASVVKKEMALRNLKVAGQWFSSYLIRDGETLTAEAFHKHCQYLQEVDAAVAVVSEQTYSIQNEDQNIFLASHKPEFTDREWGQLCDGLELLGGIAKSYGLKLAYHSHLGTGVQTNADVDRLMAGTSSDLVGLLYDTGHTFVADGAYLPVLEAHAERINHVHFKDVRREVMQACDEDCLSFRKSFLKGMFTVPGDGCIDFKPVYDVLIKQGYEGWIVIEAEQDPAVAHPLEYALKARGYIDAHLLNKKNGTVGV